jgi:predicted nucleotidyltransferase
MKLFLNIKPTIVSEQIDNTNQIQLDELDVIEKSIDDNLKKDASISPDILNSFVIKDTLNQEIWPNNKLSDEVRKNLIKIAQDFIRDLEIPKNVIIKDIIFTGSLANFNWSKFSDIDLHIVMDFNQFDADPKIIEDYFYAQKTIWNQEHDITIYKYPVELYVQNLNKNLVATSVFSVLNNKWIKIPSREDFSVDKQKIKDKASSFIYQLKDVKQDYIDKKFDLVVKKVTKIKNKIKQMRNAGLERGGELSIENLVFKVLRRTEFMDILDSYKAKSYDKLLSVDETLDETLDEVAKPKWGAILFIKGVELPDGTQRLYVTTVNNVLTLNRLKTDNSDAEPARMAVLGNQVFRVMLKGDKLVAVGVDWNSPSSMLKKLGLNKNSVAINDNKTPLHWETLKSNNINNILNEIPIAIKGIENINLVG